MEGNKEQLYDQRKEESDTIFAIDTYQNRISELLKNAETDIWADEKQLPVTEDLRQGLSMWQKRLKKRNLQVELRETDVVNNKPVNDRNTVYKKEFYEDGDSRIGRIQKRVNRTIKYFRSQSQWTSYQDQSWIDYYVNIESEGECKVSTIDVTNKSPYYGRGSQYWSNDRFSMEVMSFAFIMLFDPFAWVLAITAAIYLGAMPFVGVSPAMYGVVVFLFLIFLFIGILTTYYAIRGISQYERRKRSCNVVKLLREKEKNFVIEKFISMADSRIKSIYFADSLQEVGSFVSCDLSGFLKAHENVVNCEQVNFWFEHFSQDEMYEYVEVTQIATLTRDQGNNFAREQQKIRVRFMKPLGGIMSEDFYHDWNIVSIQTLK